MNGAPHLANHGPGIARSLVGGLIGGLAGATTAAMTTELIKRCLAIVSRQETWVLITAPLVGLALSVLVLHGVGRTNSAKWRTFPEHGDRGDLTADVVATAGAEERFPWQLAPIRAAAIFATVGLGAPMGTEAPAAHLGVAAGAWLGNRSPHWQSLARPAAVGGGAAGVAALMGIPLVGTVFVLELGRRRAVPISWERALAATMGGLVGWLVNIQFRLDLIRLVVPNVAPSDLRTALAAAVFVGGIAGAITAFTGLAIYRVRAWRASPFMRLCLGSSAMISATLAICFFAAPSAAIGPGGGAVRWAETTQSAALTLLAVALLRAAATTAAVAAGGCGGVFVPFLAIGDIAGRVFAPGLGVPGDLAGAAGAAGGIAGGYRLPLTAIAMVLGIGGPYQATATCLATVGIATVAGLGASAALERMMRVLADVK